MPNFGMAHVVTAFHPDGRWAVLGVFGDGREAENAVRDAALPNFVHWVQDGPDRKKAVLKVGDGQVVTFWVDRARIQHGRGR